MSGITQEDLKYIEDEFFDENRNTRIGFDRLSAKYGVSGRDEVVGNVSMRIIGEVNKGSAVLSDTYEKKFRMVNDYATAEKIHNEKGLTWYHYDDDAITKKLSGIETDFNLI